jgi:hypothetical protein
MVWGEGFSNHPHPSYDLMGTHKGSTQVLILVHELIPGACHPAQLGIPTTSHQASLVPPESSRRLCPAIVLQTPPMCSASQYQCLLETVPLPSATLEFSLGLF